MAAVGHIRRRAGKYMAVFRIDGVQHSRTFRRMEDARAYLREVDALVLRGEFVSPNDRKVTVAEFAEAWARVQPWRGSTRTSNLSRLENHILPTFGDRKLGSIRRSEIQAWVAGLGLAPATTEGCLRLLASIYKAAVHDRLVAGSPCDGVRLARPEGGGLEDPLTVAQVEALADRIRPELRAAVLVAARTGLRQGELFGLTEDRVRFLERSIRVDRQLVTETGGARFGPVKTQRSNRTVPVPDDVLELLAEQIRVYGPGPDRLVFHREGTPWWRQRAGRAMRQADGPGWHALRHHCASVLILGGLPVTAVAAVLGHSPAETLATYAAWFPSEDEAIRATMGRAWGQAGEGRTSALP